MPTYARLQNADSVEVNDIRSVAAGATSFSAGISLDTIAEKTAAAGVTVDGLLIKDGSPVLTTTTWTPSPSTQAGTFTGVTVTYAKYVKMGALCFCSIYFVGTQGGGNSNYITFSLPFSTANLGNTQYHASGDFEDGSQEAVGLFVLVNNSSECRAYRGGFFQWTNGANRYVTGNFFYVCV